MRDQCFLIRRISCWVTQCMLAKSKRGSQYKQLHFVGGGIGGRGGGSSALVPYDINFTDSILAVGSVWLQLYFASVKSSDEFNIDSPYSKLQFAKSKYKCCKVSYKEQWLYMRYFSAQNVWATKHTYIIKSLTQQYYFEIQKCWKLQEAQTQGDHVVKMLQT